MSGPKTLISMRIAPEVLAWADAHAAACKANRTELVEELLTALMEGRLTAVPRAPDPFPADPLIPLKVP